MTFNVERGLQPRAVVTIVVADNGGALGWRSGEGEEKRENREHHAGKHFVKCGEDTPRATSV